MYDHNKQLLPDSKGYKRLEPYEGKLSRTVLRRGGGSNLSFLVGDDADAHGKKK